HVDLAEPRIVGAAHRAPGVVEDAGAVGILEDERPVERAELAVMAAERSDLHVLGQRRGGKAEGAEGEQGGQDASHGLVSWSFCDHCHREGGGPQRKTTAQEEGAVGSPSDSCRRGTQARASGPPTSATKATRSASSAASRSARSPCSSRLPARIVATGAAAMRCATSLASASAAS